MTVTIPRAKLASPAVGATVAQVWQAVGSFTIQIAAAWSLGVHGLGQVAICLGVIVMGTAVVSGMVGDSLTVLDRHDPQIRAGLQVWTLILLGTTATLTAVALHIGGVLDGPAAVAFWLAAVLFAFEEIVRRVFQAMLAFWKLLLIDTAALAVSGIAIAVAGTSGTLSVGSFLYAVALGQLAGIGVGVAMLPDVERRLVPLRHADLRAVAGFGGWRGIQVAVGPAALSLTRMVIALFVGTAAVGALEAARILTAPATLVVQGLGSYLMASYVKDRNLPYEALKMRAVRASILLATVALAFGAAVTLLAPVLSLLVTGGSFSVSSVAVMGWACVAAATATLQPFSSLAVSRGYQKAVLGIRLVDALSGISLLVVAVRVFNAPADVAPYATALGIVLGGLLVRRLLHATRANPPSRHPVPRTEVAIRPAAGSHRP